MDDRAPASRLGTVQCGLTRVTLVKCESRQVQTAGFPDGRESHAKRQQHGMYLGPWRQLSGIRTMPLVKCGECGFVTLRDELGTGALEIDTATRTTGRRASSAGPLINADPFCYKSSAAFVGCNLPRLTHSGTPKGSDHPVVAMLNQGRECDYFRLWLPGKSPKEHEEVTIIEQLQQARQQDAARQETWNRRSFLWTVIAVGAAIASALAAVFGAYYHR
jgi:hypothetical protein